MVFIVSRCRYYAGNTSLSKSCISSREACGQTSPVRPTRRQTRNGAAATARLVWGEWADGAAGPPRVAKLLTAMTGHGVTPGDVGSAVVMESE